MDSPQLMVQAEVLHRAGLIVLLVSGDVAEEYGVPAQPDGDFVAIRGVSPDDDDDMELILEHASESMKAQFRAPHDDDLKRMVFVHCGSVHHRILKRRTN